MAGGNAIAIVLYTLACVSAGYTFGSIMCSKMKSRKKRKEGEQWQTLAK